MKKINPKLAVVALFIIAMIVFAAVRVSPYVRNPRVAQGSVQRAKIESQVPSVVPKYDDDALRDGIDDFATRLDQKVRATLLDLPVDKRPDLKDAKLIAQEYTAFIVLSRTGTRRSFIEHYQSRGLDPPDRLLDTNDHADDTWLESTAWARHHQIDPNTIRIVARYIHGNEISTPPYGAGMIRPRQLRSGGFLMTDGPGQLTAYEVLFHTVIPNLDGKEEFSVEVGLLMINDGPHGEWSVVESRFIGVPSGKYSFTPFS